MACAVVPSEFGARANQENSRESAFAKNYPVAVASTSRVEGVLGYWRNHGKETSEQNRSAKPGEKQFIALEDADLTVLKSMDGRRDIPAIAAAAGVDEAKVRAFLQLLGRDGRLAWIEDPRGAAR